MKKTKRERMFMRHIIRLSTLEIENIKNVQYGKIEFERGKKGSILGIYGQNGSGKTGNMNKCA